MPDVYNDWNVKNLKDELRERNLPVSGNKSALIERLINNDKELHQEEKTEFECASCDSTLRIAASHTGRIKCPHCGEIQRINNRIKIPKLPEVNLFSNLSSQNQKATIVSGIAILTLIMSGFMFHQALSIGSDGNEHTMDVPYEEISSTTWNCKDGTQVMLLDVNNGVEDCPDGSDEWAETMIGMMFLSCCVLLPLSLIMAVIGIFTGQWRDSSGFDTILPSADTLVPDSVSQTERTDSVLAKTIRIAGISLSGSVVAILLIGIIIVILLFIFVIWTAISAGGSLGF